MTQATQTTPATNVDVDALYEPIYQAFRRFPDAEQRVPPTAQETATCTALMEGEAHGLYGQIVDLERRLEAGAQANQAGLVRDLITERKLLKDRYDELVIRISLARSYAARNGWSLPGAAGTGLPAAEGLSAAGPLYHVPLQIDLGDEHYGINLPVAVVLRVDDVLRARVAGAIALMKQLRLNRVDLELGDDDTRYLTTVGYTPDNGLAPIPGWMDEAMLPPGEVSTEVMNMDTDGDRAEFREDCVLHTDDEEEVAPGGRLCLQLDRTELDEQHVEFWVKCETPNWKLGSYLYTMAQVPGLFDVASAPREDAVQHDRPRGG